ncbi:MAG: hypothetical protein JNL72_15820 [Flavipsychrobacter sp.]|nr:hypothetical protein [Flavipsychrobacter sp.]
MPATYIPAATIDEVIVQLEAIIEECIRTRNKAGYFAALYHRVTCRVKEGIVNGEFEDNPRMEVLDVLFANRYIAAWHEWRSGKKPTGSWQVAFGASGSWNTILLQHLFLGINAHINLDLGIASVETMAGKTFKELRRDFYNINTVLSSMIYEVVHEINRVSPVMSLLGLHATNYNQMLMQFTIDIARDGAWCFAEELSEQQGADAWDKFIVERDEKIKKLGESMLHPSGLMKITLFFVKVFEWWNPAKIIHALYLDPKEREKRWFKNVQPSPAT